jgi:hypothetical protein
MPPTRKIEISSYFLNEEKQMIKQTKEKHSETFFMSELGLNFFADRKMTYMKAELRTL